MKIESDAFKSGGSIPTRHAKLGDNRSPALTFEDVPEAARSLVLIVDDPDAPRGLFTHWVVFNIGPATRFFLENEVPGTAHQGKNSWGETRYGGPQPPDREHRYFFRLYALDVVLAAPDGATREEVEREMQGHVIAHAELMGRYAPEHAVAQ